MKEKRAFTPDKELSFRAETEGEKRYLTGYAARFNHRSKLIYEQGKVFYETLERAAFNEVLADKDLNVVMSFNHEKNQILGRNKSGTLQLSTDDLGLKFRVLVPNTTLGNDTYEMVERGDFFESSFVFSVNNEDITMSRTDEGTPLRTIRAVSGLYDVAIAVNGAYSDTVVDAEMVQRSLDELDNKLGEIIFSIEKGAPTIISSSVPAGKYTVSFEVEVDEKTWEYETILVVSENGDAEFIDFNIDLSTDGPVTIKVELNKDNLRTKDEGTEAEKVLAFRADTDLKKMQVRLLELNQ